MPSSDLPGPPVASLTWPRIRSHPLIPVVLLAAASVMFFLIWGADDDEGMQQQRNIRTVIYVGIPLITAFLWFVVLSRAPTRIRMTVFAVVMALVALAAATLKIQGVDGDLIPIVRWRWTTPPDRAMAPLEVAAQHGKAGDVPAAPVVVAETEANDFPQFLGRSRDGVIRSIKLKRDWTAHPPKLLWRREIGAAWSGFAVVGNRAVTQEQRGDDELVVCYDLKTGEPLWSHGDKARYDTTIAGIGPRATPTISGGWVYTMGGTGTLNCLELATGKRIWSVDTLADHGAKLLDWGMAGSPLVEGDQVIVPTAGTHALSAYDREAGKRLWVAGPGPTSYSSPVIMELLGQRQIVMQNQYTVTGHALGDGRLLWMHETPGHHPAVAQPVRLSDNRVVVSRGYGTGSDGFELTRDASGGIVTHSLWKNVYLKAKFATVVERDGYLYGLNDGTLTCLDGATGERAWRGERYGHGQLLLVGDLLLIQAESGDIVLVEASPKEFREVSRFTAFEEKTWNSPTLAGKYLLVRNDREAACFELAVEE